MRYLLHTVYGALAVDQEVAAFAYVCQINKNLLCLKAASDQANDKTKEEQKSLKC